MASNAVPLICANTLCKVPEGGRCVEGVPLERCPFFGRSEVEVDTRPDAAALAEAAGRGIPLHLAASLSTSEAGQVLTRAATRVVAIVAPNDAGKTSLLAGVYDLFQEGPIGNVRFAGSDTLIGFEQICHHARVQSRRNTPYMPRTVFGSDIAFYHLDVVSRKVPSRLALLLADRAGEDYLAVTVETANAGQLFELRRADTITILVNGERLVDDVERQETRGSVQSMLQALDEGGALGSGRQLAVVLTKEDSVLRSPHADRAKRDFEDIVSRTRYRFGKHFSAVESFTVAASPRGRTPIRRGAGLDRLLEFWLQPSPPRPSTPAATASTRMFDLLTLPEGAPH